MPYNFSIVKPALVEYSDKPAQFHIRYKQADTTQAIKFVSFI